MPLAKDKRGGGWNADGTKSLKYCSYCYRDGAFTRPDLTVRQMRQMAMGIVVKKGFPRFLAWLITARIPRLERWRRA